MRYPANEARFPPDVNNGVSRRLRRRGLKCALNGLSRATIGCPGSVLHSYLLVTDVSKKSRFDAPGWCLSLKSAPIDEMLQNVEVATPNLHHAINMVSVSTVGKLSPLRSSDRAFCPSEPSALRAYRIWP